MKEFKLDNEPKITPGFEVPEGYFENLENSVLQKITEKDDSYVNAPKEHDNWFNRRYRLSSRIDIDFAETSYKFIKDTGISLFDKTYKGGYKPTF